MLAARLFSLRSIVSLTFGQSLLRLAVAALAAIAVIPTAGAIAQDAGRARIMTQNMFLGSSFAAIAAATTPTAFVQAVTTTFGNIQASKPAERAAALANEIAKARPDFVALQEAWILRKGTRPPATDVVSDQLQLLLDALAERGLRYETVLIVPNLDAEAPTLLGFDARLTDRTAIIARRDGGADDIKLSNIQVQEFLFNEVIPTPGVPVVNMRGWGSVDVTMRGGTFRLVTTHLTTPVPGPNPVLTQQLQAAELVRSALNTSLPVIVVGDFNVTADSGVDPTFATYQLLIGGGLIDLWPQKGGSDPGFTCCQDATLLNPVSQLSHRVDLVLYRGNFSPLDIFLVGNTPAERTPSGLWPSDHAGVVATLRIPQTPRAEAGN
jgi:endonuclease/exonuclease/phosphatase family metal-dependent hydrolase